MSGVSGTSGTSRATVAAGTATVSGLSGGAALPGAAIAPGSLATKAAATQQGAPAVPYRIGLLLPLRSDALRQASEALRAGFLAAWERDRQGVEVSVIETGDAAPDVLASYTEALPQQDMIVGPLSRSAVSAVANSRKVAKPTIALNYPDNRDTASLPPQMMLIGLSIEDEARQMADWASREQPGATAYVVGGSVAWQRRSAGAFAAQWQRVGLSAKMVELSTANGYLNDGELVALRGKLQMEPGAVVFAALDPDQTRQLRIALAAPPLGDVPIYGTSSLNPGRSRQIAGTEMDGVRLLDMPWQLQRDHPAVMVYPQLAPGSERKPDADMERLYALGIDAYRVAREIARQQDQPTAKFRLDGVTGQLNVSFGDGTARFERRELQAVYKNGVPVPLTLSQQP
ncbi:LppC family lipoprotein [Duganella ginsengisoli]|uniref:LppC family lipoprotein n=1 Tax=Pseudoduganella ginsengisoli TaxID=1462440 RepID=A0A6L6Q0V7_9BURK|nr:LppC family lipoprotein [Pseudoduganella ginsengisoli]